MNHQKMKQKSKSSTYILEIECPSCMKEFKTSWKSLRNKSSIECPHCHFLISCDKVLFDLNEQWEEEQAHEMKESGDNE